MDVKRGSTCPYFSVAVSDKITMFEVFDLGCLNQFVINDKITMFDFKF